MAHMSEWASHNLLMQFFTLGSSKIEVFETNSSEPVNTQNDHPSHVKHVSGCLYVFYVGAGGGGVPGGGGGSKGLVHSLHTQFFTLDILKIEVFETFFLIL